MRVKRVVPWMAFSISTSFASWTLHLPLRYRHFNSCFFSNGFVVNALSPVITFTCIPAS
jgi:hypothetical protein